MKRDDEITALALEYLASEEAVRERVGDAFQNMRRAPLAKLIDEFLETSPNIDIAPILKNIADTNQGRLEDLNAPTFQSYLVAKCGTNVVQLRSIILTLSNFGSYQTAKMDETKQMLIAARDDANSGHTNASMSDLLGQIKKRTR